MNIPQNMFFDKHLIGCISWAQELLPLNRAKPRSKCISGTSWSKTSDVLESIRRLVNYIGDPNTSDDPQAIEWSKN